MEEGIRKVNYDMSKGMATYRINGTLSADQLFERLAEGNGPGSRVVALFNASDAEAEIRLEGVGGSWTDVLDGGCRVEAGGGENALAVRVPPNWTSWLVEA